MASAASLVVKSHRDEPFIFRKGEIILFLFVFHIQAAGPSRPTRNSPSPARSPSARNPWNILAVQSMGSVFVPVRLTSQC